MLVALHSPHVHIRIFDGGIDLKENMDSTLEKVEFIIV
jgi:hypothetical protein